MKEVVKGKLFQGDRDDAVRVASLGGEWSQRGIRGVICAATEIRAQYDPLLPVMLLPVNEGEPTPRALFSLAVTFCRMCNGHLFVHCSAGVNRSNAVCAAILVDAGWTLQDALAATNQNLPPSLLAALERWAEAR